MERLLFPCEQAMLCTTGLKKRNENSFALSARVAVFIAGQNETNRRKKLWNGTIPFLCEQKQKPKRRRSVPTRTIDFRVPETGTKVELNDCVPLNCQCFRVDFRKRN